MVEFLTLSSCSDVLSRQPDHVAYGKLARSCMPIGIILLHSSDLLTALLNSSPEFNELVGTRPRIRHVRDSSVGQNGLNDSLYTGVKILLSIRRRDACKGMYSIDVGKLG
jgi:hypothetical protein